MTTVECKACSRQFTSRSLWKIVVWMSDHKCKQMNNRNLNDLPMFLLILVASGRIDIRDAWTINDLGGTK